MALPKKDTLGTLRPRDNGKGWSFRFPATWGDDIPRKSHYAVLVLENDGAPRLVFVPVKGSKRNQMPRAQLAKVQTNKQRLLIPPFYDHFIQKKWGGTRQEHPAVYVAVHQDDTIIVGQTPITS